MVAEILNAGTLLGVAYIAWRVKPRVRRAAKGSVALHRAPSADDPRAAIGAGEWSARFRVIGVSPKGIRHPGSYIGDDRARASAAWEAFKEEHDIKGRFTFFDTQHTGDDRGDFVRD